MFQMLCTRFVIVTVMYTAIYVHAQQTPTTVPPASITATDSVPHLINFSGILKDVSGKPRNGIVGVIFALYKDEEGGAPVWLETQNVQADATGHYMVSLGATQSSGLPEDVFASGEARWLGVQPERQPEQPRVLLVSVPYALKAADAETIGGLPPSAFVRTTQPGSGSSGTGASTNATSSLAASVNGTGTTNFLPIWKNSTSLGNSTVFEAGGRVGINTTTPAVALDVNGSSAVRGNQNVTGALSIGTTPPAKGPFRLQVETNNQLGVIVQGPFTGVGAGIDLQTTGSGGNQWEILATGKSSSQGAGKFNIRNVSQGHDVFTIDASDTTNLVGLRVGNTASAAFIQATGAQVGLLGATVFGPVAIGPKFQSKLSFATLDVQGNNLDAFIGDPQCGPNPFAGIGFGTAGFNGCKQYSIVGNGADTFIGAPTGNIFFRTNSNTTTPMLITSAGQVGIGTPAPLETLDVIGRVRSQNLAVSVSVGSAQASQNGCLGALLSANSGCDTANLVIGAATGNVPVFIMANLNGITASGCIVSNFALVMDGNIIAASNLHSNNDSAIQSLTLVSLQFPPAGTHTFEVQESDDTAQCSGFTLGTGVGAPSNSSSNFSTSTLIVREF